MDCLTCFRGTLRIGLVLANIAIASVALVIAGMAVYGLVTSSSFESSPVIWTTSWIQFAVGVISFLTAIMGACSIANKGKMGLCAYACGMMCSLLTASAFLAIGGYLINALNVATACNMSPESAGVPPSSNVAVYDCASYSWVMELTTLAYAAQAGLCEPTFDLEAMEFKCDKIPNPVFLESLNAECTEGSTLTDAREADFHVCIEVTINSTQRFPNIPRVPSLSDGVQLPSMNDISLPSIDADALGMGGRRALTESSDLFEELEQLLIAALFCGCPSRFTGVWLRVLWRFMLPVIIQASLILLIIILSCALVCVPEGGNKGPSQSFIGSQDIV